jgi:hypothetical protein
VPDLHPSASRGRVSTAGTAKGACCGGVTLSSSRALLSILLYTATAAAGSAAVASPVCLWWRGICRFRPCDAVCPAHAVRIGEPCRAQCFGSMRAAQGPAVDRHGCCLARAAVARMHVTRQTDGLASDSKQYPNGNMQVIHIVGPTYRDVSYAWTLASAVRRAQPRWTDGHCQRLHNQIGQFAWM